MPPDRADVVVVGAGHNGLVAAVLLARAGLSVVVLESADIVGGACRTEQPFAKAPDLRQSTGAYLLGLMPPELLRILDISLPVIRRDPHYFLPTTGSGSLSFGSDHAATQRQMKQFFSDADWEADARLQAELSQLRDDIGPTWLQEPLSVEETADRYVRPELRAEFVALCRGSVVDYLHRFGFASELLVAMYAVTDGLSGVAAGPDTPGTGHNFLVHNMCRLPGSDGTWQIVRGGMGTVSAAFAELARQAGARIETSAPALRIDTHEGAVTTVHTPHGSVDCRVAVVAGDPFRLPDLVDELPSSLLWKLDNLKRPGSTMKVNLALRDLPKFSCLAPDAPSPFGATIHLLPEEHPVDSIRRMWQDVQSGVLPDFPTIEWYVHTTLDPSLRDEQGRHSSALFVQSVPYQPRGSTWAREAQRYADHLLSICDRFAPGTSALVDDVFALPPPAIEAHFGITGGHIHHVDNCFAFADRMPYATGIDGLYAASAGCHPAGSVIGAAGHNAAKRVLQDLR